MTRFFKCSTFYTDYLRRFYQSRPHLGDETYQVQYRALMDDCFAWADFWKKHLDATQRFETMDIVLNCEPLQKTWAKENNVTYHADTWMVDILKAQMAEFRPEIWMCHTFDIGPEVRKELIAQNGIRYCIAWDGIAKHDVNFFSGCDLVLSGIGYTVDYYQKVGIPSAVFKMGFEKSILQRINFNILPNYDFSFIGQILMLAKGHNNRLTLLNQIAKKIDIELWLSGDLGVKSLAKVFLSSIRRGDFDYIPKLIESLQANIALTSQSRGVAYGLEMYKILAGSKIVLNSHIDAANGQAGNMRLYEATGVGAMLLTDNLKATSELFSPGQEVVCYDNASHCIDLVELFLSDESKRAEIAKAGQLRCLAKFNLEDSIKSLQSQYL